MLHKTIEKSIGWNTARNEGNYRGAIDPKGKRRTHTNMRKNASDPEEPKYLVFSVSIIRTNKREILCQGKKKSSNCSRCQLIEDFVMM